MKVALIASAVFFSFCATIYNLTLSTAPVEAVEYWEPAVEVTYDKPAQVYIAIGRGHCSGVHIGDGYFLTAAHCVRAGPVLTIDQSVVKVLWTNEISDIALLKLDEVISRAPAPLRCSKVEIGEEVYSISSPKDFRDFHSWGRVAGKRVVWRGNIVVPLNIAAGPGSSGAPVFDINGNVVGLIVSGPQPFGNVSNMAPAARICELMGRSAEFTDD